MTGGDSVPPANTSAKGTDGSVARLPELVDADALQSMMDGFYELTSIPTALIDTDGDVIVGSGWQRICTHFHRANRDSCAHCIESDTTLTADIPFGEARLYKCKNGMWDAAMPVELDGERVGNVFAGQFFMEDEEVDVDHFRRQAALYGFPEEEYLVALDDVPRLSRETIDAALGFLSRLANLLSRMSLTNRDLASVAAERAELLERERRHGRMLAIVSEIESVLTSSLDLAVVIRRALRAAEKHLGVVASSVWTVAPGEKRARILGLRGFPDSFPSDFADGVSLADPFPVAAAIRERRVIAFERVEEGSVHQPVAEAYARYGIRLESLVAVPLISRGVAIGGLTLAWSSARNFDEQDLTLIDTLASRFAVALENARLFEAEHVVAETLQEVLVVVPSQIPGITFSRAYASATHERGRVGGDFVDVFLAGPNVVGISLGDVSGKGLDAAVMTSLVRTTLRVHALDGLRPAQIAQKANRVMVRSTDVDAFVTLWFGLLNTDTGELCYVSAGHPATLFMPADGGIEELTSADPILGAFEDSTFSEMARVMVPGDRLLIHSDGATESRSPEGRFLGMDGLKDLFSRHAGQATSEMSAALLSEVMSHSAGVLRDDVAILAVELDPPPAERAG